MYVLTKNQQRYMFYDDTLHCKLELCIYLLYVICFSIRYVILYIHNMINIINIINTINYRFITCYTCFAYLPIINISYCIVLV